MKKLNNDYNYCYKLMAYLLMCSSLTACSTISKTQFLTGITSFAACSLIGANNAPKGERKTFHGALHGGLCATAANAGLALYNMTNKKEENQIKAYEKRKKELLEIELRKSISSNSLPEEVKKNLLGDWSLKEEKGWTIDGDRIVHEDFIIIKGEKNEIKERKN